MLGSGSIDLNARQSTLALGEKAIALYASVDRQEQESNPRRDHFPGAATRHVPAELGNARKQLDRCRRPEDAPPFSASTMRCRHALHEGIVATHVVRAHQMATLGRPQSAHVLAPALLVGFVPDGHKLLNQLFNIVLLILGISAR